MSMKGHVFAGEDIVPVEFDDLDTVYVHLKRDAAGGWYYPTGEGLFNGPHPHQDIACLEYFRNQYALKTGTIYITSKAIYDVDKVLAGDLTCHD